MMGHDRETERERRSTIRPAIPFARRPLAGLVSACLLAIVSGLPQGAWAQTDPTGAQSPDVSGLTLNLSPSSTTAFDPYAVTGFDLPSIDIPVEAVGSTLFKLDLSDQSCLSGTSTCRSRSEATTLGLSQYIAARQGSGIDLVLRPRASLRFDGQNRSALVGAVVEIGEDLRRDSDFKTNTWYLFAGADAEALTYAPDSITKLSSGRFNLQDRIIVGDAQAGVGYRIGDADVSLSYMRREANAEGIRYNEDAAALSFTWKR